MDRSEIAALMEAHCQPAVMIHRPFPPVDMPRVRSHLGGLPTLPAEVTWPRTGKGVPLHFLASIDCAELPPTGGVLPERGRLLFFARVDEEVIWGDGNPHDDCRVLFLPETAVAETPAPDDLPAIQAGHSEEQRRFVLPGEPPLRLYTRWPVLFNAINSWPDWSAFGADYVSNEYQRAVEAARAAEVLRATGLPPAMPDLRYPAWRGPIALPYVESAWFPNVWIMVDRLMRGLLVELHRRGDVDDPIREAMEAAKVWLELAQRQGLDFMIERETATFFATWFSSLGEHTLLGIAAREALHYGLQSVMRYVAQTPATAALIPTRIYNEMGVAHLPMRAEKEVPGQQVTPWRFRTVAHHQMLGQARSSQEAHLGGEDDRVLLLQLASDYGVNFMFCDVGEADFWITRADLAERRFDRVVALTQGG